MVEKRKYADRREYLIRAVAERRRKIKLMAIHVKGGCCQVCGYNKCPEALDLHHVRGEKKFAIWHKGYARSWERVKKELEKCILVCANCHRAIEAGITQLSAAMLVEKRGELRET